MLGCIHVRGINQMRAITRDNLATADCPYWRYRYRTPLTPRAVRSEMVRDKSVHLTELDKALDDEQAAALEDYWQAENVLAGNARGSDYAGDRVMTSREYMTPIADRWLPLLAIHKKRKSLLSLREVEILNYFCEQMNGADLSDAQCALKLELPGRNKARAWQDEVKRVAERLAAIA